jgi:hypothetical protein
MLRGAPVPRDRCVTDNTAACVHELVVDSKSLVIYLCGHQIVCLYEFVLVLADVYTAFYA